MHIPIRIRMGMGIAMDTIMIATNRILSSHLLVIMDMEMKGIITITIMGRGVIVRMMSMDVDVGRDKNIRIRMDTDMGNKNKSMGIRIRTRLQQLLLSGPNLPVKYLASQSSWPIHLVLKKL